MLFKYVLFFAKKTVKARNPFLKTPNLSLTGSQDIVVQVIAFSAWSLNRAIEILNHGGLVLSKLHATEAGNMLLQHLQSLQFLAMNHGLEAKVFRIRPKCHYLFHSSSNKSLVFEPVHV